MSVNSVNGRRASMLHGVGLAIIALLMAGCSLGANNNAAPQRTSTLTRGTLVATVNATGNIQPEASVDLSFDLPGTVAQVNVKAGDVVRKGDVLAKLDTTDLELAVAQAQAGIIAA